MTEEQLNNAIVCQAVEIAKLRAELEIQKSLTELFHKDSDSKRMRIAELEKEFSEVLEKLNNERAENDQLKDELACERADEEVPSK